MQAWIKLFVPETAAQPIEDEHELVEGFFKTALLLSGASVETLLTVIPTKSQVVVIEIAVDSIAVFYTNGVVKAVKRAYDLTTKVASAGAERQTRLVFTHSVPG